MVKRIVLFEFLQPQVTNPSSKVILMHFSKHALYFQIDSAIQEMMH